MSAYEGLARFYDGLTRDVDYTQWADWYQSWFRQSRVPVRIVLDLACGTGTVTCLLAQRGYSMIGADQSAEMLAEAWEKAAQLECEAPVFLNQPAQALDLYGTIDACVSSLDSLNYVTDKEVLREALGRVHTFLMPGGYFLFDVLAPEHLRQMDGQIFVDETDDVFCLWRTEYRSEDRTVVYGMDLFEREGDCWYREQEEHTERAWSQQELEQVLREAGFCSIQRYGGVDRRSVTEADRRIYYVCVNGEGGQTPGQCSEQTAEA